MLNIQKRITSLVEQHNQSWSPAPGISKKHAGGNCEPTHVVVILGLFGALFCTCAFASRVNSYRVDSVYVLSSIRRPFWASNVTVSHLVTSAKWEFGINLTWSYLERSQVERQGPCTSGFRQCSVYPPTPTPIPCWRRWLHNVIYTLVFRLWLSWSISVHYASIFIVHSFSNGKVCWTNHNYLRILKIHLYYCPISSDYSFNIKTCKMYNA